MSSPWLRLAPRRAGEERSRVIRKKGRCLRRASSGMDDGQGWSSSAGGVSPWIIPSAVTQRAARRRPTLQGQAASRSASPSLASPGRTEFADRGNDPSSHTVWVVPEHHEQGRLCRRRRHASEIQAAAELRRSSNHAKFGLAVFADLFDTVCGANGSSVLGSPVLN